MIIFKQNVDFSNFEGKKTLPSPLENIFSALESTKIFQIFLVCIVLIS